MNRLSVLLVLSFSFPLAAHADEASHRAKAEEMMTMLHTESMVDQVAGNIKKQVAEAAAAIIGPNPTPEKKAQAADVEKQADAIIDTQLGWDAMKSGFTDVYVKNFTEEQLDAILAFYKTPSGSALLKNMPEVNAQITQFGTSRLTGTLQPQLKELFANFKKNLAPPSPSLTPAPAHSTAPATHSPAAQK